MEENKYYTTGDDIIIYILRIISKTAFYVEYSQHHKVLTLKSEYKSNLEFNYYFECDADFMDNIDETHINQL